MIEVTTLKQEQRHLQHFCKFEVIFFFLQPFLLFHINLVVLAANFSLVSLTWVHPFCFVVFQRNRSLKLLRAAVKVLAFSLSHQPVRGFSSLAQLLCLNIAGGFPLIQHASGLSQPVSLLVSAPLGFSFPFFLSLGADTASLPRRSWSASVSWSWLSWLVRGWRRATSRGRWGAKRALLRARRSRAATSTSV